MWKQAMAEPDREDATLVVDRKRVGRWTESTRQQRTYCQCLNRWISLGWSVLRVRVEVWDHG